MNGAKRIEGRPAAPAPTQFRKAPEIKTDYNTMPDDLRRALLLGEREHTRPWAILLGAGVFLVALWLTAFALNADLPTWTDAPAVITALVVGIVLVIGMMLAWVGW